MSVPHPGCLGIAHTHSFFSSQISDECCEARPRPKGEVRTQALVDSGLRGKQDGLKNMITGEAHDHDEKRDTTRHWLILGVTELQRIG